MATVLIDKPVTVVSEPSPVRSGAARHHLFGSYRGGPVSAERSDNVANSSEARFAELVLPEVEILGRVALSLTRNNADAEDLVQETMLRAYRAIDRFDGRYPRAWLMTIMRNAQINRVRRKRPELMRDPDEAVRVLSDTEGEGSTTEDNVMYAEFDPLVERAFTNLPEKFREVVELVDLNELSYQEAADALDVPVGTVMSRLHRGRRRIREELSDTDIGEMRQRRATDEVTP